MAGSVTATEITHGTIKKVKFAWTSSSGGAADATSTNYYDGKILHLVTVPDGTAVPTADYDVAVNDSDSVDVLAGAGVDRSNTLTQHVVSASLGAIAHSKLTLAVTNAGDTKKGTVYLYIR